MRHLIITLFFVLTLSCNESPNKSSDIPEADRYNVGFLIMDGTYNTELTAPFDIFQHTIFRKGIKSMNTFLVADTYEPVRTF